MLYGQFLRDNGDDLQGVMVFRRNVVTGDAEADAGSLAFKYHGMVGPGEYDALLAQHFGDTLVGAGGNRSIGGAVWHGDLVVTFAEDDTVPSLVTNLMYSWIWGGKNISVVVEYFYNGFGQADGCYSMECLARNPELLNRIVRGELFTLGRNYIAANAMIEIHPLFTLTPNLFTNVGDPSALLQVVFQNDLRENLALLSSVNLPMGADGTEFGGLSTDVPSLYFASGPTSSSSSAGTGECASNRRKSAMKALAVIFHPVLSRLCEYKQVELLEGKVCIDHIHICVALPRR